MAGVRDRVRVCVCVAGFHLEYCNVSGGWLPYCGFAVSRPEFRSDRRVRARALNARRRRLGHTLDFYCQ